LQGCLNSKNYSLMESRLGKHSRKRRFWNGGPGLKHGRFVLPRKKNAVLGTPHLLRYRNFICGATHFSSSTSEIDFFRDYLTLLPKASATSSVCGPAATKLYLFISGSEGDFACLSQGASFRVISICCSHSQGCKLESQREQKNVKIYSFEWNPEYMLQRLAHWRMRHTRIATPSCARAILDYPYSETVIVAVILVVSTVTLLFLGVLRFALGMAGARPLISILRQPFESHYVWIRGKACIYRHKNPIGPL